MSQGYERYELWESRLSLAVISIIPIIKNIFRLPRSLMYLYIKNYFYKYKQKVR